MITSLVLIVVGEAGRAPILQGHLRRNLISLFILAPRLIGSHCSSGRHGWGICAVISQGCPCLRGNAWDNLLMSELTFTKVSSRDTYWFNSELDQIVICVTELGPIRGLVRYLLRAYNLSFEIALMDPDQIIYIWTQSIRINGGRNPTSTISNFLIF